MLIRAGLATILSLAIAGNILAVPEKTLTPDAVLNRAFHHYYGNRLDKAFQHFERFVELYGDHEVPLRYMARIAGARGRLNEAIGYLQRGIEADDKSIPSLMTLGELYLRTGRYDHAAKSYRKVFDIDPYHERAILTLASIYQRQKKGRESSVMFKRLILAVNKHGGINDDFLRQSYASLGNYYYLQGDYRKAISYYEKLLSLNPENQRVVHIVGELYKITGEFQQAIERLEKLQRLSPGHEVGLESLIECYYIVDDRRIVSRLKKFAEVAPGGRPLVDAMRMEIQGDLAGARKNFETVLKQNSNRLSAHVGMVRVHRKANNRKELKKEAFSVMVLAQKIGAYDIAQQHVSDVFSTLGEEAVTAQFEDKFFIEKSDVPLLLEEDIENLAFDYTEAYSTHAASLDGLEQRTQALVYYRRSLDYVAQLSRWYHWQKDAIDAGKMSKLEAKAAEIKKKIGALNQRRYKLLLNMGWLLQESPMRRYDDALRLQRQAMELMPEYPQANFLSGIIFYNKGEGAKKASDYNSSIRHFEKAINLYDKNVKNKKVPSSYYFYLGMALEKVNRFPEAEVNLKKTIELEPHNSTYLNYLGYMYSLRGIKLPAATLLLDRALENDPENEAYLDSLGWILYKKGEHKRALELLLQAENQAARKKKTDSVIYFHLAETYYKLGDYALSHFFYSKALNFIDNASEPIDVNYIKKQLSFLEKEKGKGEQKVK